MEKESTHNISVQTKILLLCLGLLIISIAGYLASYDLWVRYIFAHLGGLSIMGLFGCWAGAVAKKKGHGYWKAFSIGFILPTVFGIISACLVYVMGGDGCGGIVSIFVALLVIIYYYIFKLKDTQKHQKQTTV